LGGAMPDLTALYIYFYTDPEVDFWGKTPIMQQSDTIEVLPALLIYCPPSALEIIARPATPKTRPITKAFQHKGKRMTKNHEDNSRISTDSLLTLMGSTPADNHEQIEIDASFLSGFMGQQIKALIGWQKYLDMAALSPNLLGPFSILAGWQGALMRLWLTDPIRHHAEICAQTGDNPNIFGAQDERLESLYARLLHELCGLFLDHHGRYDERKARNLSSSKEGKNFLRDIVRQFAWLERQYNSLGRTRLMAYKEMLKCLLMTITESPISDGPLPFAGKWAEQLEPDAFADYLAGIRTRLENLHAARAFDIKTFSEVATRSLIGFSPYEIVEYSERYSIRLRKYLLPPGVEPNGRVLYINPPLINKPEILDLAEEKSIVAGLLQEGYAVYMVDYGNPGVEESRLSLDFYAKTIHDDYLSLIKPKHSGQDIYVLGYCMGGTLMLPYVARRAEERLARGRVMDIQKVAFMVSPFKFDDREDGMGPMRQLIRHSYDPQFMEALFGNVNIPPQFIEEGMQVTQPGVRYSVPMGFFSRSIKRESIEDAAPFLYWLLHGSRFPARAHREWVKSFYMEDQIARGTYCLPSILPEFDGKPVNLDILEKANVRFLDYRGLRDPITPIQSSLNNVLDIHVGGGCVEISCPHLNRSIEQNVGHIFVVSKRLLAEFITLLVAYFDEKMPSVVCEREPVKCDV
jgi:poly(3-hydroxyalkanoate) synthetase